MPYKIVPVPGGEKVQNTVTGHLVSSRPLDHVIAVKQLGLLEGLENGWKPAGRPPGTSGKDEP